VTRKPGTGSRAATVIPITGQAPRRTAAYRERNSTADRALGILSMFNDERTALAATEVASHLNVARSTAYRYLQSLVQSGFIEEAANGRFQLGTRILELGRLARRGNSLSAIVLPVMRELAQSTGETVLLTRLAGTSVICLERADAAERALRISYEPGQVLPTNAGASAHVLLAWLDEPDLSRIISATTFTRFTGKTIADGERLRKRLAETRAQGYAISQGELDTDVLGIAAPIRSANGKVIAGISIAALASRIPSQRLELVVSDVRAASERITSRLELLEV